MKHHWLSIHADYACRHSGACCSSNWTIPVEPELISVIGEAVAHGVLPMTADGACVFFDRAARENRCEIHRKHGSAALPVSCRHFPRVCLLDPRGVSVTLSHYCPTAAAMLFRRDRKLEIVDGPDPLPGATIEGLDARDALPPLLSPSILMDHVSYARFETFMVAVFADDAVTPETALERISAAVERLGTWTPGREQLADVVASLDGQVPDAMGSSSDPAPSAADIVLFDEARRCVMPPHEWDPAPRDAAVLWCRWVGDRWPAMARPVRHYLAAKAFASWSSYQGQGLRTVLRSLHAALSILKMEILRLATEQATVVGEDVLMNAFRRADLMLVHLADPVELARAWSKAERTPKRYEPRGSW